MRHRFAQFTARQLGHPSGAIGRWVLGPMWNRRNRALNDVSLAQLALQAMIAFSKSASGGGYLLGRMSHWLRMVSSAAWTFRTPW